MTGNKKRIKLSSLLSSISTSSLHVEIKKSSRGLIAVISGVIAISEYTEDTVELLSHSGRISFMGDSMEISVLEGRIVEIYGRISEVRFSYGKT